VAHTKLIQHGYIIKKMHEKKIVLNKIPQNTVTRNYAKEKQLKNLHATLYL